MMSLDKAIQRATDRLNLIGENCDLYEILYQYKAISQLPQKEIDEIYDAVCETLGF